MLQIESEKYFLGDESVSKLLGFLTLPLDRILFEILLNLLFLKICSL